MKSGIRNERWILSILVLALALAAHSVQCGNEKNLVLDAGQSYQTIDGFGVNITPAQWRDGNLKPAIDLLVDDLGCVLFRFDCFGTADWLDPGKRDKNGRYPVEYLKSIYTGKIFQDAWETFRYLNSKGIEPFFNISGKIPKALAGEDGQTLVDYAGYAEMAVSMLEWAARKENLKFKLFSPFNENDLGFPEGPRMESEQCLPAVQAVLKRMQEAGLGDIGLIVMDDSWPKMKTLESILSDSSLADSVFAFATHCYGNGGDEDGGNWFLERSGYGKAVNLIQGGAFKKSHYWLTEYGDLDQSGEVEFGVAWRSTRRLLKRLNEGFSAGLAWDAFDNFHEHDQAWAAYGLLKTDREKWTYTPKRRYSAAKQVYRFVKPGFRRVDISGPPRDEKDVYATWRMPLKHLLLSAFASPDGKDFTLVGMSTIESDARLSLALKGLAPEIEGKTVACYRTSRNEDCVKTGELKIENGGVEYTAAENSIFTLTTVK